MAAKKNTQSKSTPATVKGSIDVDSAPAIVALRTYATTERATRDTLRRAMIDSAPAVFASFSLGEIGRGKALGTPEEIAQRTGVTRATVTGMSNLGHCLALGINPGGWVADADGDNRQWADGPDAALWGTLSSGFNASWLTSVLKDRPTVTKIRKAAKAAQAAKAATPVNGPAKGKKRGTPDSQSGAEKSADKSADKSAPATNAGRLTQVETLLAALTQPLSDADRKSLQKISARVALILAPAENVQPVKRVQRTKRPA